MNLACVAGELCALFPKRIFFLFIKFRHVRRTSTSAKNSKKEFKDSLTFPLVNTTVDGLLRFLIALLLCVCVLVFTFT